MPPAQIAKPAVLEIGQPMRNLCRTACKNVHESEYVLQVALGDVCEHVDKGHVETPREGIAAAQGRQGKS